MPRLQPAGCRRAVTLLELLVVLVVLGLSAAVVVPFFRPPPAAAVESALIRARTLAVRRGQTLRLDVARGGDWTVHPVADPSGAVLLAGRDMAAAGPEGARSMLITALGTCLPEGAVPAGRPAWDPVRCALTTP